MPIFTSSPGDSSIGMNLAALQLEGSALRIDPLRDVNQSAAIVYDAKKAGRSGVLILGGGSPKNFILQTEPQIQEVLGLEESGHDYFLQVTDARPDTGGLSGATPQEAMTWGKVDPEQLPDTVTCYLDSTVALPLLTAYALANRSHAPPRRLMDRLDDADEGAGEGVRGAPPAGAGAAVDASYTIQPPGLPSVRRSCVRGDPLTTVRRNASGSTSLTSQSFPSKGDGATRTSSSPSSRSSRRVRLSRWMMSNSRTPIWP